MKLLLRKRKVLVANPQHLTDDDLALLQANSRLVMILDPLYNKNNKSFGVESIE